MRLRGVLQATLPSPLLSRQARSTRRATLTAAPRVAAQVKPRQPAPAQPPATEPRLPLACRDCGAQRRIATPDEEDVNHRLLPDYAPSMICATHHSVA